VRRLALAAALAALLAGCGSHSASHKNLNTACDNGHSALAGVASVSDLGSAAIALNRVVRLERHALAELRAAGLGNGQLAGRLSLALMAAERSLAEIQTSDPQKTMDPIRTGVPAARRAVGSASALVQSLCATARA
jgi:hypothetical protein